MADPISSYFHIISVATTVSSKSLHFAFSSKCGSYHGARAKLWSTSDSSKTGNKRASLQTNIRASCPSGS
jgi:hypothetical protein